MSKYLPYHAPSVNFAKQLVVNEKDPLMKYSKIVQWVRKNIKYDYIRALNIPKYGRECPDVAGCWNKHMGICMDIASMTVGMLKAVGIQAYMCWGHADGSYHAWVEAGIKGKKYRFDSVGKANKYNCEKIFRS